MSRKLSKAVREAVDRSMSLHKKESLRTELKPLKKAPVKREMMNQSTACGMVAIGAPSIPPANRNKKSKL